MRRFDRIKQLETQVDKLYSMNRRLEGDMGTLETQWLDMRDQLRRSYQRLEKAAQRAEPSLPPSPPIERPAEVPADPYSKKVALVRSQQDAVQPRTDKSAG